jgi:hypothetical protein
MPQTHADLVRAIKQLDEKKKFLKYVHLEKQDNTAYERFLIHAVNQVIYDDLAEFHHNHKIRSSCTKFFTSYEFERCVVQKYNQTYGFDLPLPDHRQFLTQ